MVVYKHPYTLIIILVGTQLKVLAFFELSLLISDSISLISISLKENLIFSIVPLIFKILG